jgi:hypothetical protein
MNYYKIIFAVLVLIGVGFLVLKLLLELDSEINKLGKTNLNLN